MLISAKVHKFEVAGGFFWVLHLYIEGITEMGLWIQRELLQTQKSHHPKKTGDGLKSRAKELFSLA